MSNQEKNEAPDQQTVAVITLALNMFLKEAHDYERMTLTINKVMRPYSPWSSKLYGMRQVPNKMPTPWSKFR